MEQGASIKPARKAGEQIEENRKQHNRLGAPADSAAYHRLPGYGNGPACIRRGGPSARRT